MTSNRLCNNGDRVILKERERKETKGSKHKEVVVSGDDMIRDIRDGEQDERKSEEQSE